MEKFRSILDLDGNVLLDGTQEDHVIRHSDTLMDQLLNKYRNEPPNGRFYDELFEAIKLVYTECLHWRMASNGFWKASELLTSTDEQTGIG